MQKQRTRMQRLVSFVETLPEVCANDVRFRVPFLLPRWFRMPQRVWVAGQWVRLQTPDEESVAAELLTCMLRNVYGLGHGLGEVGTIVGVGANLGFFLLAARAHYPHALIHGYEPNPRILPMLRANTAMADVTVFAEAVGGRAGAAKLLDDGPSNQAHVVAESANGLTVPQVTLETVVRRMGGTVDLLKLDCEGAEWEILQPGPWWKAVRNVRMEYHLFHGETAEQATDALKGLGFRVTRARPSGKQGGAIWARQR
jgi:FkbM family methyltransferase